MAIYALYDDTGKPSRFGKGLFIGMAFVAGAGSIITLLGAARGAVAISFFQEVAGREITFFELSYYMLPVGIVMTFLLWLLIMIVFRPEKKTIPGLRQRTEQLYSRLGGITRPEVAALAIVGCAIFALGLRSVFPALDFLDKSAVILTATLLFFVFRILDQEDLERIPWNIVLLFGGAMSIGFCLKDTGAADWMAINFLGIFSEESNPFIFVVSIGFFIMLMTNLIMNVAAIAIFLPVALTMSPYLGASQEVVLFTCLVAAGMPFLFLIGAAPNAIAYESKQFTSMEFLKLGIPASAMLIGVVAVFVMFVWPLMGMPIFLD
jgi:sodium-dependent dicarboxylate transporter 2/3/5